MRLCSLPRARGGARRALGWWLVACAICGAHVSAGSTRVSAQGATEWSVAPFVVELVGPLQRVRFEHDADARGALGMPPFVVELEVALAPGERRRFVAPALVPDPRGMPFGGVPMPELVSTEPPGAEAQVVVVSAPVPRTPRGAAERAARLVPPADDTPRRAPWVALACLAVALPVVLARGAFDGAAGRGRGLGGAANQGHVRRSAASDGLALGDRARLGAARGYGRALAAILVSLAVAAGAVALDARDDSAHIGVNAGDSESISGRGRAVSLRAPRSALRLGADGHVVCIDAWTRAASIRAPVFVAVGAAGDGVVDVPGAEGCAVTLDLSGVAGRGSPVRLGCVDDGEGGVWVLAAERGTWLVEREFSAGSRLLRPEVNTWGACADVWVRDAAGAWGRRGPWALGAALPEVAADGAGGAPPGWLAAGLPQGVQVLVARLAPGTWAGPAAAAGAASMAPAEGRSDVGQPALLAGEVWLRRIDL